MTHELTFAQLNDICLHLGLISGTIMCIRAALVSNNKSEADLIRKQCSSIEEFLEIIKIDLFDLEK